MKVAVVVPSLGQSATITVALNISAGLTKSGHIVDIYYFDGVVERPIPEGSRSFKISFFKKFDFSSYDVIHSHNLRPDLYLALNRRNIRCGCVTTVHNYVSEELENYHGKILSLIFTQIWKAAWKRFDKVVCLTEDAVKYYKNLLPKSNISYIYNGVERSGDFEKYIELSVSEKIISLKERNYFVIGTYCNQIERKGLDQIVRLLSFDKSLAAVIIGNGPENKKLKEMARILEVEDRCVFFDFLPYAYIYNKYFNAYIIPSRTEGFGIALIEAVLSNTKVICSDITVFREMFSELEVSFFRLDDIESMKIAINRMKSGEDKRIAAIKKAKEVFSVDTMTKKYIALYQSALKD